MGDGHLLGDPGAGVEVRLRVFVFLALLGNGTKPRGRRMRSLTKAVPTEKAAIIQAMPRGRRWRRRRGPGGGGDQAAAATAAGMGGAHQAALAAGSAAAR